MELIFLGTGSAFVPIDENFQSNMILESESGKKLLIDCGTDARHSLHAMNLSGDDIDAVFISHFHADHVGGLEWLALSRKFCSKPSKPHLIVHPSMRDRLWNQVLSGGLETIKDEKCNLNTYFQMVPFSNNNTCTWENINFNLVKTVHVFHNGDLLPSYGLAFSTKKNNVFITTDTQFCPDSYESLYESSDIIFHDCETSASKSCVHADYGSLVQLPDRIKNKMWLYHYSGGQLPNAKKDGFLGFVQKGQVFDL